MRTSRSEEGDDTRGDVRRSRSVGLSRRRLLATVSVASLSGCLGPGPIGRTARDALSGPQSGTEQEGEEAIVREDVWVETDVDADEDGTPDRIHVEVARPPSTTDGERYPVILQASPYYGPEDHGDTTADMLYDRRRAPAPSEDAGTVASRRAEADGTSPSLARATDAHQIGPTSLEDRYLPQGYVVAYAASLGTERSTGCYTAAAPVTIDALASVIDWFNGRATAYDARSGGSSVEADWTTGTTGMIGASANGELANGVATTGVEGLEAIVPQSANASHYSLFRANGTPIAVTRDHGERIADLASWLRAGMAEGADCDHWIQSAEDGQDRETGNYNDFWHEREFLTDADAVDVAVLLSHGVADPIVKPNQFADWYDRLDAHDVPVRLWLHDGGHTSPGRSEWFDLLDRWWEYWLKGVENGVMDEDPVTVSRGWLPFDDSLETYESWPVPGTEATTLRFESGGTTAGSLVVDEPGSGEDTTEPSPTAEPTSAEATEGPSPTDEGAPADATEGPSPTDEGGRGEASLVDDPSTPVATLADEKSSEHRLRYETPQLGERVHVSGRVVPSLSLALEEPGIVSAALVEYGPCGGSTVVTRGWADPLNRPTYGEYDDPVAYKESLRESRPLEPGERVRVEFPLQATDHVFDPGSRIGLVVYGSDSSFTLYPPGEPEVTLAQAESSLALPVAGGATALSDAVDAEYEGSRSVRDRILALGVGGSLAVLGAGGYLLRRRRDDGEP